MLLSVLAIRAASVHWRLDVQGATDAKQDQLQCRSQCLRKWRRLCNDAEPQQLGAQAFSFFYDFSLSWMPPRNKKKMKREEVTGQ